MKLHYENLNGRPVAWWIGEIIAYIIPTVLIILAYINGIVAYSPLAYFIAIVGVSTTIILVFVLFRKLGNIFKKKFIKYR